MTSISTTVATSGDMSLCSGKAIFPINGSDATLRLGWQTSKDLIDGDFVTSGLDFFAGICGPAWALRMDIDGETDGNELNLDPIAYEVNAGMLFSIGVGFSLSAHGSIAFVEIGFAVTAEINVLEALDLAYEYFMGKKLFPEVEPVNPPGRHAYKTFGITDDESGTLGTILHPDLTMHTSPGLIIQWDLWSVILASGGMTEAWKAVKWAFDIAFGPDLKISLNVPLEMKGITIEDATYANLTYNAATGKIKGTTSSPSAHASADHVQINLHEVPSITFGIGFFLEFKFLQIISVRVDIVFDILQNLGYSLFGEYDQLVGNGVGAACAPCAAGIENIEIYEVEFA